jgi:hypothetical protein
MQRPYHTAPSRDLKRTPHCLGFQKLAKIKSLLLSLQHCTTKQTKPYNNIQNAKLHAKTEHILSPNHPHQSLPPSPPTKFLHKSFQIHRQNETRPPSSVYHMSLACNKQTNALSMSSASEDGLNKTLTSQKYPRNDHRRPRQSRNIQPPRLPCASRRALPCCYPRPTRLPPASSIATGKSQPRP